MRFSDTHRANLSKALQGHQHSAETRDKIRQKALGRKVSPEAIAKALETKQRNGTLLRGENHPCWKGGRPWERFKAPEYRTWRTTVLERDNYTCQECRRQCKKRERGLVAHHIKSYAEYPELRYAVDNGRTLCRRCHRAMHNKPIPDLPPIPCACGCGTMIAPIDPYGRPREYVNFHYWRGKLKPQAAVEKQRAVMRGRSLAPEHRAKISAGLRNSDKRTGAPRWTWNSPYMSQEEFTRLFAIVRNGELAERCHVAEGTITLWGRRLGLRKPVGRPPRDR